MGSRTTSFCSNLWTTTDTPGRNALTSAIRRAASAGAWESPMSDDSANGYHAARSRTFISPRRQERSKSPNHPAVISHRYKVVKLLTNRITYMSSVGERNLQTPQTSTVTTHPATAEYSD